MARKSRNKPIPRNMPAPSVHFGKTALDTPLYWAGLYIRLSKEDSGKGNPNTVENQQALLQEFVKNHPDIQVFQLYIDNGYTGTDFRRPSFQRMVEDARQGKINCIVVKDLSRFGRNYLETGDYLEKIFPFLKLRFISVTDHIDICGKAQNSRISSPDEIEVPLKNIVNEVYAKDISRKAGSAIEIKKREGKYGGGVAPYGYQKSEKKKGTFEVDEEAAEVVRYIFELRSRGYGYCSIVKDLNEKRIKSPSAYRFEKGIVKNQKMKDVIWKRYAIEDMLRDQVYLGKMVRGKTYSAIHRGEKRHRVPREEWIVVSGTHEPIISQELYDKVQAVNEERTREHEKNLQKNLLKSAQNPESQERHNIWKGKLFCGDCGITMGCMSQPDSSFRYYCPNYKENGTLGCRKKYIQSKKLEKAVLEAVRAHLKLFVESREMARMWDKESEKKQAAVLQEINRAVAKENQSRQKLSTLYFDYKESLLTLQEFLSLKEKYQKALSDCEKIRKEKEALLDEIKGQQGENKELSDAADRFAEEGKVTQAMVDCLIERAEIFSGGRIQITFRYGDQFEAVLLKREMIEIGA